MGSGASAPSLSVDRLAQHATPADLVVYHATFEKKLLRHPGVSSAMSMSKGPVFHEYLLIGQNRFGIKNKQYSCHVICRQWGMKDNCAISKSYPKVQQMLVVGIDRYHHCVVSQLCQ